MNIGAAPNMNQWWVSQFVRGMFSSSAIFLHCRASAAVLFDSKQRKMHVPAKLKVRCTFCAGAAGNRRLCVHELQVLNEIASRSRYMELTGVEEDVSLM